MGDTNINDDLVKEFRKPYENIDDLDKKKIIEKEIFEYIFSFEDPAEREKIIMELEERAKEVGAGPNFKRIYKQYEKEYLNKPKKQNSFIKPKHDEIAKKILEDEKIINYNEDIYLYENGVYKKDKNIIERKVIELMSDSTSRFRTEVYKYLQLSSNIKTIEFNRENEIINFRNGLYNLKNKKLIKHTSEIFTINQINTNLNFQAKKVQAVEEVLDRLSCGKYERKQTILEMIGYSMTTSVKLQKAFVLYGKTARNGKNTLLNIINELIGRENISCVSFKDLNTNRFASSIIKNKILNSGTEMPNDYIEDVSKIKAWVTGDYVTIEEKGKQMEGIIPYAKFIFNANELPRTGDKTDGFYRRLQIIPLEYSFTDKDANRFNFNELISEEALEYLTKISVEAYLNMGESFSNNKESKKETDKYKIENDSALSFIEDKQEIERFFSGGTKYTKEFYSYYENYCKANKYTPIRKK